MSAEFLKERLMSLKPEVDSDSELPDASAPYQAHGRATNAPVYTLHCALGKDGFRSFQYAHLDSDSEFRIEPGGHVIIVRFAGTKVMTVTIRGRNLWKVYDYLHQHRIAWIMRADRDFAAGADKQPLIVAIDIEEVKERDG